MDQGTGRYAAFLSYSHKDETAARWLHRRLESYRIPRRLVGSAGEHGSVPARLTPIFRDREDLPAAGDLSERVRAALAQSRHLVVICSPHSAASLWVAKEIDTFRQLHPGRPVYAAIVEGDPDQCFPRGLAGAGIEPLAADLRPGRDGRRLGFLKLVAGLGGIGLDALVQRDSARRLRRVTAVTVAAVVAMLVMAVLTLLALTARREAQRQRAEAEGLVEFMLTDLRTKLRGVGRLDVMQAVNERALAYYRREDLRQLSDPSVARRARILRLMGEDEIRLGHMPRAQAALAESYRLTALQLRARPDDPQRRLEQARNEYWAGQIAALGGDWRSAGLHYRRFSEAAERLLAADPGNVDYLTAAASAALDLGTLQFSNLKDYAAAEQSYARAADRFGKVAAMGPDRVEGLRNQANAYGWLADSFYMRGLWRKAVDARSAQNAIIGGLYREHPEDRELGFRFAVAERGLGVSFLRIPDKAGARAHLFNAYALVKLIAGTDPDNGEWQLGKAMVACNILYSDIGLPPRTTVAGLRTEARSISASLKRRGNPRAAEIAPCVAAIDEDERKSG
jgi:hypothetical protein